MDRDAGPGLKIEPEAERAVEAGELEGISEKLVDGVVEGELGGYGLEGHLRSHSAGITAGDRDPHQNQK
jgi:hypothetical protein